MTDDDMRRLQFETLTTDALMLRTLLACWEPRIEAQGAEAAKLVEDIRARLEWTEARLAELIDIGAESPQDAH